MSNKPDSKRAAKRPRPDPDAKRAEVHLADGFEGLKSQLPPSSRRALVLMEAQRLRDRLRQPEAAAEAIFGLGDVCGTSNAKTAAAARKQAPVVANNVLVALGRLPTLAQYDGYGSCPLTVERGKITALLGANGAGKSLRGSGIERHKNLRRW